jgi:biofilm PGA synthesis N-glycosyltransferase PgaC
VPVAAALFFLSGVFVVYVLFGYPVLLAIQARRRPVPVRKAPEWKTVSVLLPVRNGEAWIAEKLRSILALDYPRELLQIIVVDDGSQDSTCAIVAGFQGIELVSIPPGGKAVALNEGLRRATGEIVFFTDVRQALDAASLRQLVACFADPAVGAASGELIIRRGASLEEANVGAYWRYEKWLRKRQTQVDSMLGATGCIYAMRAHLARPLEPGAILDDVELPLGAFFEGYRIVLDDSARAYDYPTSLDAEFRRKVRTLAGVYQTMGRHPLLLTWRNRMWLHFVSHKLGRLLLPWAMLMLLGASFGLPAPWNLLMIAGQAAFYLLAGIDLLLPERFALKRITSPARTFVVLMAAAWCAAFFPLLPKQMLWGTTKVNVTAKQ